MPSWDGTLEGANLTPIPATFKTGRSRKLTMRGRPNWPNYDRYGQLPGSIGPECQELLAYTRTAWTADWFGVHLESYYSGGERRVVGGCLSPDFDPVSHANRLWHIDGRIDLPSLDPSDILTCRIYGFTPNYETPHTFDFDFNSVWTVQVDVEEWCTVGLIPIELRNEYAFPIFGDPAGSGTNEGLPALGCTFFEKMVPGGLLEVFVTDGQMPHGSGYMRLKIFEANAYHANYFVQCFVSAEATKNESVSIAMPLDLNGLLVDAPVTRTSPNHGGNLTTSLNGSWQAHASGNGTLQLGCAISATVHPPVKYGLEGRIRNWLHKHQGPPMSMGWLYKKSGTPGGPIWADALKTVVSDADQNFADSTEVRYWDAWHNWNNTATESDFADEIPRATRVHMLAASLTASGEDEDDWRLQFKGRPYPAFSLQLQSPYTFEPCESGFSQIGGASLTYPSGTLRIATAGSVGGAGKSFAPGHNLEPYRYLKVRLRSVGNADVPVRLTLVTAVRTRTWDFTTGADGAWTEVEIDLCVPHSLATAVDEQDSRWPLHSSGTRPRDEGPMWGVNVLTSMNVEEIPASRVVEVDFVQAFAKSTGTATFLPEFNHFRLSGEGGNSHLRRHLLCETDGRVSSDWHDQKKVVSGLGTAFIDSTLQDVVDALNTIYGWLATPLPQGNDGWHNLNAYAGFLWGGGSVYVVNPSTGFSRFVDGIDLSAFPTALTVVAQPLYDEVSGYPGIGDAWNKKPYSIDGSNVALPLRVQKFFRGQGWGLTAKGDEALANASVKATLVAGAVDAGSGTSDSKGYYKTLVPYSGGRGEDHKLELQEGAKPNSVEPWISRKRTRASFWIGAASAIGKPPSYDVSRSGRHARAYIREDTIRVGFAGEADPRSWADLDTAIAAESVSVRWVRASSKGRLRLLYSASSTVYERYSDDEGLTWSAAVTIGAGKLPAAVEAEDGLRYVYRLDGTTIRGTILTAQGAVVESFDAKTGVDADSGLAVAESTGASGEWRIGLLYIQGGSLKFELASDGKVFS